LIAEVLDWASTEGFEDLMRHYGVSQWESPLQFRQRYLLRALRDI
jgi:hypothetical protein